MPRGGGGWGLEVLLERLREDAPDGRWLDYKAQACLAAPLPKITDIVVALVSLSTAGGATTMGGEGEGGRGRRWGGSTGKRPNCHPQQGGGHDVQRGGGNNEGEVEMVGRVAGGYWGRAGTQQGGMKGHPAASRGGHRERLLQF